MRLIVILFSVFLLQTDYQYKVQNKDYLIKYNFVEKNKKIYMMGHIVFQKNNKNGINTNIGVIGHRIGAVPQTDGTFKLRLPDKKGKILVFNSKIKDKWQFKYEVKRDSIKREFTRDHTY